MLTLYGLNTPNVYKVTIGLEEMGFDYELKTVDVRSGKQFEPNIIAMNPNAKIPILHDHDNGITISESNAILLYLAKKRGGFFPEDDHGYAKAIELLFFQAASVGPLFGQRAHFAFHSGGFDNTYALARYTKEGERLYGVLEEYLSRSGIWFLDEYSIVDMAVYGWMHTAIHMGFGVEKHPNLEAWCKQMAERPNVIKAVSIPAVLPNFPEPKRPREATEA
ncbi:glutathione S-transferase family protein [Lentilitoribacter sp. EG35]|uniref:glutathione S-transferase family protein n=1 Tax=Lentilitoribacter sp. EG35 TaxID=3234192 RepID=UPI00345F5A94